MVLSRNTLLPCVDANACFRSDCSEQPTCGNVKHLNAAGTKDAEEEERHGQHVAPQEVQGALLAQAGLPNITAFESDM